MISVIIMEALTVGIFTVILGLILYNIIKKIQEPYDLNNTSTHVLYLFVVGVMAHLVCELTGINKWYCTGGNACRS